MSFRPGELLLNKNTKELFEVIDVEPWIGDKHSQATVVSLKGKANGVQVREMDVWVRQHFIKSNMWTLLLYG